MPMGTCFCHSELRLFMASRPWTDHTSGQVATALHKWPRLESPPGKRRQHLVLLSLSLACLIKKLSSQSPGPLRRFLFIPFNFINRCDGRCRPYPWPHPYSHIHIHIPVAGPGPREPLPPVPLRSLFSCLRLFLAFNRKQFHLRAKILFKSAAVKQKENMPRNNNKKIAKKIRNTIRWLRKTNRCSYWRKGTLAFVKVENLDFQLS